jgi:PBP1b-binding outer membrane lipoprotein LpoB
MKRLLILATAVALVLSLSGCMQNAPAPTTAESTTQATTQPGNTEVTLPQPAQTPLVAVSLRYITEETYADDGTLIFVNRYPNISLTIPDPDIADKIIVDFLNHTDPQGSAEQVKQLAKEAYTDQFGPFPFTSAIYCAPM